MKSRRIIAILLALMMVLTFMPAMAFADDGVDIASGTSGTCEWVIDANGVLTISEGTMEEWGVPWRDYCEQIKSVRTEGKVKLQTCSLLFSDCYNLTDIDLANFDTSSVTDMYGMFSCCTSLKSLDLRSIDTSKVRVMARMFWECKSLTDLDLSSFDTSNVESMSEMFDGCVKLTNVDVSRFNTSKVTDMMMVFSSCNALTNLDLANFDTSNVTNMYGMFYGCSSLTDLNVTSFNTSKVTDMRRMFEFCTKLPTLDLSSFNTSKVTQMRYIFGGDPDSSGDSSCGVPNAFTLILGTWDYSSTGWAGAFFPMDMKDTTTGKVYAKGKEIPAVKNHTFVYCDEPITYDVTDYDFTLEYTNKTYTGKPFAPKVECADLTEGVDYEVTYANNINAGTAKVTITGIGTYSGNVVKTFTITKAANTLTAKGKTATVKFKKLKKKNQTVAVKSAFTVSKAQGKVTYKKASGNKKITVSSAGKITVKKGLKKGTYKVKVNVTAAGSANYKPLTRTVTVTIKIR